MFEIKELDQSLFTAACDVVWERNQCVYLVDFVPLAKKFLAAGHSEQDLLDSVDILDQNGLVSYQTVGALGINRISMLNINPKGFQGYLGERLGIPYYNQMIEDLQTTLLDREPTWLEASGLFEEMAEDYPQLVLHNALFALESHNLLTLHGNNVNPTIKIGAGLRRRIKSDE